jgi:hypothetical protein
MAGGTGAGVAGSGGGPVQPQGGWVNRTPAVLPASWPAARRSMALVADDEAQRVVLYGGYSNAMPVRDTWDWNGSSGVWTKHEVVPAGVFDQMAVAYDQRRTQTVIFGGESYPSAAASNGVWTWGFKDDAWSASPAVGPAPRRLAKAVYDYQLDNVLVQGGAEHERELWQWNVGTNTWTNRSAVPQASVGAASGFVWDARRRVAILFGGAKGDELWEWYDEAGTWKPVVAAAGQRWPAPRELAGLAFDRDNGSVLLFGGRSQPSGQSLNDLWRWRPESGWKLLDDGKGGKAPAPRHDMGITYDPAIGRLLIFGGGGDGDSTELADVWMHQSPAD